MPSIAENQKAWGSQYEWSQGGDEWSAVWGGSSFLWWGTLFPRLHAYLPTGTILEIAPGFGRCTQFLANYCKKLVVVDLNERCIDACRKRFVELEHIEYHVNDGKSLEMVEDRTIDFAFSYDSLVHAEADVLEAYVHGLGRKLSPNGIAFLHHSNLGTLRGPGGEVTIQNSHWRATTMSAWLLVKYCADADLTCMAQELIGWGSPDLTDCFSLVTPAGSRWSCDRRVRQNPGFMAEAANLASTAHLYRPR
jgi:2-polyprenyl-3-methyl-5-hydroxy-6-metoxy-1,4-benzoquinol methylase